MAQGKTERVLSSRLTGALLARPKLTMLVVFLVLLVALQGGAAALDVGSGGCEYFCVGTEDKTKTNTGP
jgi:hypothetical protein